MHEETIGGGAGLTHVADLGGESAVHREVQIRVLEDEQWRVSAEFHRAAQHVPARLLQQQFADRGGPGERELPEPRVGDHRVGDVMERRGDDIDDPVRHAGVGQHLRQQEGGQRGEDRRSQHDGAAGRQRRRDLARRHRQREVPRGDEERGSDRSPGHQLPRGALRGRPVVALDPRCLLAEPAQELGSVGHLTARLGERFAHLQSHHPGEVLGARDHGIEGPPQDLGSASWGSGGPVRCGIRSRPESGQAVRDGGVGHLGDDPAGRRVVDGHGATGAVPPLAVDEQARLQVGGKNVVQQHCRGLRHREPPVGRGPTVSCSRTMRVVLVYVSVYDPEYQGNGSAARPGIGPESCRHRRRPGRQSWSSTPSPPPPS
ncbi:hypothetical protein SDC9_74177 [bioreactor metagenome]|uniref:Uncharacterized protein n=1 Tax=bioreactor metagenome TaxID=1076179 RepID=A0A644YNK1_9ZZZZ